MGKKTRLLQHFYRNFLAKATLNNLICCLCVFCTLFCLSGCNPLERKNLPQDSSDFFEPSVQNEHSGTESNVQDAVYTDVSHQNSRVSCIYPVFYGESMQEINDDILASVKGFAENYYGKTYTDLQLELTYKIKRYDSNYLSLVFTGTGNVSTAAYPIDLFWTKNYDLQKKQIITLSALHTIDYKFAEALYVAVQEKFTSLAQQDSSFDAAVMWEIFQAYYPTVDALLSVLQKCDTDSTSCQSYITRKTIGVSLPVPHVGGDHVEAEVDL